MIQNKTSKTRYILFVSLSENGFIFQPSKLNELIDDYSTPQENGSEKPINAAVLKDLLKYRVTKPYDQLPVKTNIKFLAAYLGLCVFVVDLDSSILVDSASAQYYPDTEAAGDELREKIRDQSAEIMSLIKDFIDVKSEDASEQDEDEDNKIRDFGFHWALYPLDTEDGKPGLVSLLGTNLDTKTGTPYMIGSSGGLGGWP